VPRIGPFSFFRKKGEKGGKKGEKGPHGCLFTWPSTWGGELLPLQKREKGRGRRESEVILYYPEEPSKRKRGKTTHNHISNWEGGEGKKNLLPLRSCCQKKKKKRGKRRRITLAARRKGKKGREDPVPLSPAREEEGGKRKNFFFIRGGGKRRGKGSYPRFATVN